MGLAAPNQPITITYPKVPNIKDLNDTAEQFTLRVDVQIVNNDQGGSITVNPNGQPQFTTISGENQVHTFRFPLAASEATDREIRFQLNNASSDSQIIYVVKAEP